MTEQIRMAYKKAVRDFMEQEKGTLAEIRTMKPIFILIDLPRDLLFYNGLSKDYFLFFLEKALEEKYPQLMGIAWRKKMRTYEKGKISCTPYYFSEKELDKMIVRGERSYRDD